ncbi:MAG: sel1 repeat family protein [Thermoguttaceae bacterium]|nr:sel1 repeat family protein [Thermoguttaceae bacterium]
MFSIRKIALRILEFINTPLYKAGDSTPGSDSSTKDLSCPNDRCDQKHDNSIDRTIAAFNRKIPVERLKQAAESGDAKAQFNLAFRYMMGLGVEQDKEEFVKWLRLAAQQGYVKAQYNYGCCFDQGYGVEEDKAEAAKWFRLAAEKGYAPAQYNLANCYYKGEGVPKDLEEALKWYRKAAKQHDESAIEVLKVLEQKL